MLWVGVGGLIKRTLFIDSFAPAMGKQIIVFFHKAYLFFQFLRQPLVVAVQKSNIKAFRRLDCCIAGDSRTGILVETYKANTTIAINGVWG
jgi:hypothetical protein